MQEARGGEGAPRRSPGSGRRQVPGAPRDSVRGAALPCAPRPPLRSPGGVGTAHGWRPGNGLAAGARAAAGAQPLLLASPSRAPPPPPPPPPHSSPRRSGFAPRPRSEAGRRSDVSARRGCRFPPRGGRGGGARCANPRRGSPASPPRAAGRGDREGGGLLKGQSGASRVNLGPRQRRRGAVSPPQPGSIGNPCSAHLRSGGVGLGSRRTLARCGLEADQSLAELGESQPRKWAKGDHQHCPSLQPFLHSFNQQTFMSFSPEYWEFSDTRCCRCSPQSPATHLASSGSKESQALIVLEMRQHLRNQG
nr:translation initiation factor IF-2-like [Equus asinus]